MTTAEILEKAKALIEKGWAREHYAVAEDGELADCFGQVRPPVAFCAEGALTVACGDYGASSGRAAEFMCGILPPDPLGNTAPSGKLLRWNDAPGRTQAEVVAAFTKAIELAKAQP